MDLEKFFFKNNSSKDRLKSFLIKTFSTFLTRAKKLKPRLFDFVNIFDEKIVFKKLLPTPDELFPVRVSLSELIKK